MIRTLSEVIVHKKWEKYNRLFNADVYSGSNFENYYTAAP